MTLFVDPGMKVVGDQGEGEAGIFGLACPAHKIVGGVLLARKGVSYLCHV